MKKCIVMMVGCIVLVFAALLCSCASLPKAEYTSDSLRSVAEEYWKLRIADNYEATYKMEAPQKLPPYAEYQKVVSAIKKFSVHSFSIKDVRIETASNVAVVDVAVSFFLPQATVSKPFVEVLNDRWVYLDGTWRHVLPE